MNTPKLIVPSEFKVREIDLVFEIIALKCFKVNDDGGPGAVSSDYPDNDPCFLEKAVILYNLSIVLPL